MRNVALIAALILLGGCATSHGTPSTGAAPLYNAASLPAGESGAMIRYGRALIMHTRAHLGSFVEANMDCAACHVAGGTKPRGGSFAGIYAQFPQWSSRAHRLISLQDRLAECFLYSENGHPPPYESRAMEAMVAYIAYLSRGVPVGSKRKRGVRIARLTAPQPPNAVRGARIYAQKCSLCHGANGAGTGNAIPPLWGARSFNDGAGMHKVRMMAGFVRYNMPKNAPGTLSTQQAFDVAAFVLTHKRPHFDPKRKVVFPSRQAGYF